MISRTLPPSIFSMTSRPLRVATTASSSSREAPPVGSASGAGASGCDGVPDPKRLPALREAMAASRASAAPVRGPVRSEEHTSELQSRGHLVCRLLLEKKKKKEQRDIVNRSSGEQ